MLTANQLPDATVHGGFKTEDYTAKLTESVSCLDNQPVGTFNMFVSGKEVWHITSHTPREIHTEKSPLSDHVHSVFDNVTVKYETQGKKYENCTAFVDAVEWPLGGGVIGLNITMAIYKSSNTRPVFEWDGIFSGTIKIFRDISCEL